MGDRASHARRALAGVGSAFLREPASTAAAATSSAPPPTFERRSSRRATCCTLGPTGDPLRPSARDIRLRPLRSSGRPRLPRPPPTSLCQCARRLPSSLPDKQPMARWSHAAPHGRTDSAGALRTRTQSAQKRDSTAEHGRCCDCQRLLKETSPTDPAATLPYSASAQADDKTLGWASVPE